MENIVIDIYKQNINIYQKDCWMRRGDNTIILIKKAFEIIKHIIHGKINLSISLTDHFDPSFFCTCGPVEREDRLVPCWSFYDWYECGIIDYDKTCNNISINGLKNPVHDQLFWIGNAMTNPIRGKLLNIANTTENFKFIDSGHWIADGKTSNQYISLIDHPEYRFLLDVCGNGYSARAKFLFFSGRPVFYQKRESNEYWFYKMKPFEHYIPLEHDLSDIYEKFFWLKQNPDIADTISKRSLYFAKNNLTQRNAIHRYCNILLDNQI